MGLRRRRIRLRRVAGLVSLVALGASWLLAYRVSQCPPEMMWSLMAMPGVEAPLADADCMTMAGGGETHDGESPSCPLSLGGIPGLCAGTPTVPAPVSGEPLTDFPERVAVHQARVSWAVTPYVSELLRPPRV